MLWSWWEERKGCRSLAEFLLTIPGNFLRQDWERPLLKAPDSYCQNGTWSCNPNGMVSISQPPLLGPLRQKMLQHQPSGQVFYGPQLEENINIYSYELSSPVCGTGLTIPVWKNWGQSFLTPTCWTPSPPTSRNWWMPGTLPILSTSSRKTMPVKPEAKWWEKHACMHLSVF